jgi:cytochrome b involved in lipid metabolism
MKKIIFIVVGLLVLAGGAFWAYEAYEEKELENYVSELNNNTNTNTAENTTDTNLKTYTLADISVHKDKVSCWMAIDGSVYDVTTFIDKRSARVRWVWRW